LKHPIHVPGDGKCQPPAQSLLAKKLALSVVQVADLEEKKGPPTIPVKGKSSTASAQPVAKMVSPSEEKKLVLLRKRTVVRVQFL
jgi:hypothetical protein